MHEASIAQSIVQTVLKEAKRQEANRIESVEIEIGELTFLGIEQVQFWVKTGFKRTIAENAKILFRKVKAKLHCDRCGYKGHLKLREDPAYHMALPSFSCPHCQSAQIKIVQGKEVLIRRIKILKH